MLHYQQHTFDDLAQELYRRYTWQRLGATLVRPVLRRLLLRYSPVPQQRAVKW